MRVELLTDVAEREWRAAIGPAGYEDHVMPRMGQTASQVASDQAGPSGDGHLHLEALPFPHSVDRSRVISEDARSTRIHPISPHRPNPMAFSGPWVLAI